MIDLTGRTFGRWLVVGYAGDRWWKCVCRCGTLRAVRGANLRSGSSKSCGCATPHGNLVDITGQRFGKWIALHRDGADKNDHGSMWKCRCDGCGLLYRVRSKDLRFGKTEGCQNCRHRIAASAAAWSTVKEEKEKAAADPGRRPISRE